MSEGEHDPESEDQPDHPDDSSTGDPGRAPALSWVRSRPVIPGSDPSAQSPADPPPTQEVLEEPEPEPEAEAPAPHDVEPVASEAAPPEAAPEAEPPGSYIAVAARDAVKQYGEGTTAVRAIDGINLEIPRGHFVAIMGPSGSGKSTLLHCLAGLDDLTAGQTFIGDVEVSALNEKERTRLRRDKVGFIFQSFNLVPTLTAIENITLPLDLAKKEPDKPWVKYLIDTVALNDRLGHLPSELSGGQQQRVAAARALASRPEIVFADEPTGNLDSRRGTELLQFLRSAVDEFGQTMVMVTHDPIAASYADAVIFLADGRVVEELIAPDVPAILDTIRILEV